VKITHSSLLIFCLLTGLSTQALANDAVFGGTAADLVPIKEKNLKMASEDIEIIEMAPSKEWDGLRHWQINATYTFENPTKKEISATFGFPEMACDEEGDCNTKGDSRFTFHNMKTSVDGKQVKVSVGKVDKDSKWAPELGQVHMFKVTIPAGKKVEVVHNYQMGTSGSSMQDEWVSYVTKTGSLWNGPIGSAKFTIKLLRRPWGFSYPADYKLKSYETEKDGKHTSIVFAMKNWVPKQDLNLLLGSQFTGMAKCPPMQQVIWEVYQSEDEPQVDLMDEYFKSMSDADLRKCRNLVYAAHGYTFKDKKLQKLFYKYQTPVDEEKTRGFWGYSGYNWTEGSKKAVVFAPSSNYSPDHLTKDEVKWVKAFKAIEKRRKSKKK